MEAERSKDELRDIMTRMVGAEVRYTRLGYWMRRPPYGYVSERIETAHGKRTILRPHPQEAQFITEMFRLRTSERYTDEEIAQKLNEMGYQGRSIRSRTPQNTKGYPLTATRLWQIVRNPIYAGINNEKWTNGQPVKCAFNGLVSLSLFNKANKGKRIIVEHEGGKITIRDEKEERHTTTKGTRNADFPYKRLVVCPQCNKPLLGSYSKGKSGKRYPAYHCHRRGHYFRVRKEDLEARVDQFMSSLQMAPEYVDRLSECLSSQWEKAQTRHESRLTNLDNRIQTLQNEIDTVIQKFKILNNASAIRRMEEELEKLEREIDGLKEQKQALETKKPQDYKALCAKLKHFVKHLDAGFRRQMQPIKRAKLFDMLFDQPPTYEDLAGQTPGSPIFSSVNPLFLAKNYQKLSLVTPRGIEPLFPG